MQRNHSHFLAALLCIPTSLAAVLAEGSVIDSFTSDTTSPEWNQSTVLNTGAVATIVFDTTTNVDQLTYSFSGGSGATQATLLRDDSLPGVGNYVQTKISLTGTVSFSHLSGIVIDEASETPSNRSQLNALIVDNMGRLSYFNNTGLEQVSATNLVNPANDLWLRLTLASPTTLQGSYSTDGVTYIDYGAAIAISNVSAVGYYVGNSSVAGATTVFDDFTVTPEPSSLGLLAVSGLLFARRRRTV